MSQELRLSREEVAALDRIEAELKGSQAKAFAAAGVGDLCEKYRALKGSLEVLVKILKKIPGFGAKAAAALEFLMGLADIACPV
jgi:hypothetical protein